MALHHEADSHALRPAAIVVYSMATFSFQAGASVAAKYGIWAALPFIPVLYMVAGFSLAATTVIVKALVNPKFQADVPVKMWSADFAKWWLVNRMVDTTNQIFMRHFRGTLVLNYFYSLLVSCVSHTVELNPGCRHTLSGKLPL